MREAEVLLYGKPVGLLSETETGYAFSYYRSWLQDEHAEAVCLTLPLRSEPYTSQIMFPFFDGLIPEGWLLELTIHNWKLNSHDRMGLLLAVCRDCIGAVSLRREGAS